MKRRFLSSRWWWGTALAVLLFARLVAGVQAQFTSPRGPSVSLNPQPIPPGSKAALVKAGQKFLNPQPIPPRWLLPNRGGNVMLNPQPIPPRIVNPIRR